MLGDGWKLYRIQVPAPVETVWLAKATWDHLHVSEFIGGAFKA